ncbi:hypothetical protein [Streptomyces syringium]|uniref:hypothetical protein n=1 Tax=Streptomyces syringium TaxID=76729 RepID=UPI0037CDF12C
MFEWSVCPAVQRLLVGVVEHLDGLAGVEGEPVVPDWQPLLLSMFALRGRDQFRLRRLADEAEERLRSVSAEGCVRAFADASLARALADAAQVAAVEDLAAARLAVGDFDPGCTMPQFADHVRGVLAGRGW